MLLDKIKPVIEGLQKTPLSQIQTDSINAIENACTKFEVINKQQIAYILATAYYESRLKPIEEIGKGHGLPYGSKFKQAKVNGAHVPYTTPDKLFYGRGFCQITWLENYEMFGKLLGIDLLNNPELALSVSVAAYIIVVGMKKGLFTGVSLIKYFDDAHNIHDPINARKIINGTDKADLIAGYYNSFYNALK